MIRSYHMLGLMASTVILVVVVVVVVYSMNCTPDDGCVKHPKHAE